MEDLEKDRIAKACVDAMLKGDKASLGLGMEIVQIQFCYARLTMVVRPDMVNGHKICHGGFIFTLADSSFAFVCNGHNQIAVGQHCSISYLNPAYEGDILTAIAQEIYRKGRSGITDVAIYNQKQEIIAQFRGNSRTLKGTLIPE